jgi:hypothetical protein
MENTIDIEKIKIWPEDLFEINDIVALGETHGKDDEAILSFIEQFSSQLKGVFFEEPVNLQQAFDLFLETGEISDDLEDLFDGAKKEGKDIRDGILKLLTRLKELSLRVMCIDSSKIQTDEYNKKSQHGYYFLKGESRDEDMFNNIMNYYGNNPGKFLVICGANHLMEGKHFRTGKDTLGTRLKNVLPEKTESIILS